MDLYGIAGRDGLAGDSGHPKKQAARSPLRETAPPLRSANQAYYRKME